MPRRQDACCAFSGGELGTPWLAEQGHASGRWALGLCQALEGTLLSLTSCQASGSTCWLHNRQQESVASLLGDISGSASGVPSLASRASIFTTARSIATVLGADNFITYLWVVAESLVPAHAASGQSFVLLLGRWQWQLL